MNPVDYAQWYYLIYLIPGGIAFLTLMLSMLGGGVRHHRVGHGGHHAGHSGVRHHAGRAGAKARTAGHARHGIADQVLALFGFGRVPSVFIWASLLIGWGVFGFWATRIFEESMRRPSMFVLPSMIAAVLGAVAISKVTGSVVGRIVPQDESNAVSTVELCGLTGAVVFPIDSSRGRIHIYDQYGTMHDCRARTARSGETISRGATVLVVDYDAKADQLIVEESA